MPHSLPPSPIRVLPFRLIVDIIAHCCFHYCRMLVARAIYESALQAFLEEDDTMPAACFPHATAQHRFSLLRSKCRSQKCVTRHAIRSLLQQISRTVPRARAPPRKSPFQAWFTIMLIDFHWRFHFAFLSIYTYSPLPLRRWYFIYFDATFADIIRLIDYWQMRFYFIFIIFDRDER